MLEPEEAVALGSAVGGALGAVAVSAVAVSGGEATDWRVHAGLKNRPVICAAGAGRLVFSVGESSTIASSPPTKSVTTVATIKGIGVRSMNSRCWTGRKPATSLRRPAKSSAAGEIGLACADGSK
jgi:hypothetical protein